jgi:predicted O-methyltransferase YrrM
MAETTISQDARRYVSVRYSRPDWATGSISRDDAAFLFDTVVELRPQSVAEIGVASGVSTTFLSTLLSDRLPESRLYAFDKLNHVYNNPSKPVGAFLLEVFGRVPPNVSLGAGVSSSAIRASGLGPERFDLVFLDANHNHPWPCLDVLSILDIVQPGAWIVLHDVNLPLLSRESTCFGPLYLLRSWPGEKRIAKGGGANIGAIRLFADPVESAAALATVLRIPWADDVRRSEWRGAAEAVAACAEAAADELSAIIERPRIAGRGALRDCEIVIRGANPWTRFAADLVSEPLTLHANLPGEPPASIAIRGLNTARCQGLVFPNIFRASDASCPLHVRLSIGSEGALDDRQHDLVFDDSESQWAPLLVPENFEGTFDIEMQVEMAQDGRKLHGCWVKFEALHFV